MFSLLPRFARQMHAETHDGEAAPPPPRVT